MSARSMLLVLMVGALSLGRSVGVDGRGSSQDYRSWTRLTPQPHAVSFSLAVQCAPVTPEQLERERKDLVFGRYGS